MDKLMTFINENMSERDKNTLANALQVAAARFDEDAETFGKQRDESERILAEEPDTVPIFHPSACTHLKAQFERQARDTRDLLGRLLVDYAPEDEEAA